jgi:hypothetical protein
MTASLATIDDFADRIPDGIAGQEARAQAMLDDASALIRSEAGKTWLDEDVPDIIRTTCMSAAKRAFLNPEGISAVALDGNSASFVTGSPDVFLTSAEKKAVRKAAGRTGVWSLSTTRSEDDLPDVPSVVDTDNEEDPEPHIKDIVWDG